MDDDLSKKRMAENEVVFRKANTLATERLSELKHMAHSEGHDSLIGNVNMPLHFYCECSDENCRLRIVMKPSKYKKLHRNKSQFIVRPGHQVPQIERIVEKTSEYFIVEKFITPPDATNTLQPTPVDNVDTT
jgi:hypothetical protein